MIDREQAMQVGFKAWDLFGDVPQVVDAILALPPITDENDWDDGTVNHAASKEWNSGVSRGKRRGLANAPGVWRWEDRGDRGWWRVHDELKIVDGPHEKPSQGLGEER